MAIIYIDNILTKAPSRAKLRIDKVQTVEARVKPPWALTESWGAEKPAEGRTANGSLRE